MAEYIDKQRLYGYLCDTLAINCSRNRVLNLIYDWPPTADVAPVVHGRWSTRKITDDHTGSVSYSHFHDGPKCKYYYVDSGYGGHYYCPNCGAKMDGGADNAPS